jgi:predicted dehydrogenase
MGIVGAGFVSPHHIDAARRLGFVDIVALAASSETTARDRARALGVPKGYGDYRALIDDPGVHVVHVAAPNHLHFAVSSAAIAKGKHVVSEKPLAMTSAESRSLLEAARRAGIVHAVMFNYRGNPLVQEARRTVASGGIGTAHFLHGRYLQDWLLEETDYSWRLEPEKGGASSALGDIGSHWCDLAEHVSGLRITQVLGDMSTVVPRRRRPRAPRNAFASSEGAEQGEIVDIVDIVDIRAEDLASVLLRFDNGARGSVSIGQVCAGHKNDLVLEICGSTASIAWRQERQNDLWLGRRHQANEVLQKDPSLLNADSGKYARLPGGHQEGWADAMANVMRDIYEFIADDRRSDSRRPVAMATFEDGLRANMIVEAILASATAGGVWTAVDNRIS